MQRKFYKKPLFWFLLLFVLFGVYKNISISGFQNRTVFSDGRGYYAYLPAILIYNDPTYKLSMDAEAKQNNSELRSQYYIFKNKEGKYFNKYFPGVAIMQLPFFAGASAVSYLSGREVTGYSNTFSNFFYLGHLFYSVLGMIVFFNCLKLLFPRTKKLDWLVIFGVLSTPLIFYMIEFPISHSYTFLLFGLFTLLILRLKTRFNYLVVMLLGLLLGLIVITRPTNILVVLAIPLILGSSKSTLEFFKKIFSRKLTYLIIGLVGFFSVVSILLLILKWQSGEWFLWPYNGEGFNWTTPMFWQSLLSFRAGIVLHSPIVLVSFLSVILFVNSKRFHVFWWSVLILVNLYVIASWWCWDYASLFGSRPFTEWFFFLLMPIVWLLEKYPKQTLIALACCATLGSIRYVQVTSGYMVDQRFTSANYLSSLAFWKSSNFDRWSFTQACEPFGKKVKSEVLLDQPKEIKINAGDAFALTAEKEIDPNHVDARLFVTVSLEKWMKNVPMKEVLIAVDGYNTETNARCYLTQPLFNDRFEAHKSWKKLVFSEFVQDNFSECNRIKVYIWNQGQNTFKIRNFRAVLDEYRVVN